MSNEQKTRTLIEDLPVAEQEMTAQEMKKVEGGRDTFKYEKLPMDPPPPMEPIDNPDTVLQPIEIKKK